MDSTMLKAIQKEYEAASDKTDFLNTLNEWLHTTLSPHSEMPVNNVKWVPIEQVQANDYNPNSVASNELKLLHTSISHDGYTQPIVTIWDNELQKFIIIDGFHRYFTCRSNPDIQDKTGGRVPIVVLQKEINDRMASTVRHNRARGKHSVNGMANLVFSMLDNGWADADICNELGMEPDELFRLKHMTGFSKLFEDVEYHKSWETRNQLQLKKKYLQEQKEQENNAG
jgi:ParB-like chromosome segregation protein Spo0J